MKFENPFSLDDFDRAGRVTATPEMHADSWFAGVQACIHFVEQFMKPHILGLIGARSPREEAVLDIYYGIVGFTLSINALRNPWNVQAIAGCSRSTFELYNDLLLVHQDASALGVERFHAFVDVERLRVARVRLRFFDAHAELPQGQAGMDVQRDFVRDDAPRIEADVQRLWSGRWPKHWSGIRGGVERAQAVGLDCEALYWQYYAHLSWLAHTASVGTRRVAKESIHMVVANALELVRLTVPSSFGIVAGELRFDGVIDEMDDKLEFLRQVFFFRLTALKLGQPERFSFIDDVVAAGPEPRTT